MLALALGAFLGLGEPAVPGYGADQAAADAGLVLRARGKDYIDARARLEAHPEPAAPALLAQLEQPLGPAERERVLSILSGMRRPELIPMFADLLRASARAGRGMQPWRTLLTEQGAAAAPALSKLAADRELSTEDRCVLLDDLVGAVDGEGVAGLVGMLGQGDRTLQAQLRRSLAHRGRERPADTERIVAALDEAIDGGTAQARAAAVLVRASLAAGPDAEFEARLVRITADESAAFVLRVAAIHALAEVGADPGDQALAELAREHLAAARRGAQASEILGWLALRALPRERAAPVVDALDLVHAEAPRLAALGYAVGGLNDGDWLAASRRHPWPQVRTAALGRVEAPCSRELVQRLAGVAGPVSRGGEKEAGVARAAVVALGRCRDEAAVQALRDLLHEDGIGYEQRAEAARQLVERGGPAGTNEVAQALSHAAAPALAERLAGALGRTSTPNTEVRTALCATIASVPNAAATARRSFDRLFAGQRCDEP